MEFDVPQASHLHRKPVGVREGDGALVVLEPGVGGVEWVGGVRHVHATGGDLRLSKKPKWIDYFISALADLAFRKQHAHTGRQPNTSRWKTSKRNKYG